MNKNKHTNLQTIIRHLTSKQCHTTLQDLGVVITIVVYRTCECITYVTIIIINLLLKVIRLLQLAMTHQTFLENVISLVDIGALVCSFINDLCVQTHIECMERIESMSPFSYTLWMSGLWRDAVVDDFGRKRHFNEFFAFIFILFNPKNKHIYTAIYICATCCLE